MVVTSADPLASTAVELVVTMDDVSAETSADD